MTIIYRYVGSQVILASVEMTKRIEQPGLPLKRNLKYHIQTLK